MKNKMNWRKFLPYLGAFGLVAIIGASFLVPADLFQGALSNVKLSDLNQSANPSAVEYLKEQGIISGYADGTFQPNKKINRAEMLKILITAAGKKGKISEEAVNGFKNKSCFSDLNSEDWYVSYVCYAKEQGIVSGYAGNNFRPNQEVLGVEAYKMALVLFDDFEGESDPWYQIYQYQVQRDYSVDTQNSLEPMTRDQMADLVTRMTLPNPAALEEYIQNGTVPTAAKTPTVRVKKPATSQTVLGKPSLTFPINSTELVGEPTSENKIWFEWNEVKNASKYELLISSTSKERGYKTVGTFQATKSAHSIKYPQSGSTTYFWKIRAYDQKGTFVDSDIASFIMKAKAATVTTTSTAITTPQLIYPANGSLLKGSQMIDFSWNKVPGAVKYRMTLRQTVPSSNDYNETFTTNNRSLYMNVGQSDVNYFWKVSAIDASGKEMSSKESQFTIGPVVKTTVTTPQLTAPQLTYPTNNAALKGDQTINFSWSAVPAAVKYQLFVRDVYSSDYVLEQFTTTNSYASFFSASSEVRTYRWYVKAFDANGKALTQNSEWEFTLGPVTPTPAPAPAPAPNPSPSKPKLTTPILKSPANGITAPATLKDIVFQWEKVEAAEKYRISICAINQIECLIDEIVAKERTSITFYRDIAEDKYEWDLRAIDSVGNTVFSESRIIINIPKTEVLEPKSGQVFDSSTQSISVKWKDIGLSNYVIAITDQEGSTTYNDYPNATAVNGFITAQALLKSESVLKCKKCSLTINTVDSDGLPKKLSDPVNFSVEEAAPVPTTAPTPEYYLGPLLTYPEDGSTLPLYNTADGFMFNWDTSIPKATGYRLYIKYPGQTDFSGEYQLVGQPPVSANFTKIPGTYQWYVEINDKAISSQEFSFTLQ